MHEALQPATPSTEGFFKSAVRKLMGGKFTLREEVEIAARQPSARVHAKVLDGERVQVRTKGVSIRGLKAADRAGRILCRKLPDGSLQIDGYKRPARSRKVGFVLLDPSLRFAPKAKAA